MFGKLVVGVLAAAGVVAGVGVATTSMSADDAVVTRIVDGDTFDATVAGRATTIRLLNIDTPETKDPDTGVQCLGPEATARLGQMIPVGSSVSLAYDDERTDGYDRTLAGVYDDEGRLVNAELAREGLGTALVVGGNDRFYGDVLGAQNEARAAARGLYSVDRACTLPAQVQAVTSAVTAAQQQAQQPPTDPAGLDRAAATAAGLVRDVDVLRGAFTGPRRGLVWTALSTADERRLTDTLVSAGDQARRLQARLTALADAARERDRLAAEQAERE
ncbi:MAG: thermonuclease family protein, partial [Actinomycetota bacterium]|nr:thermonuclease family protein [Actinomycetota bacterium]